MAKYQGTADSESCKLCDIGKFSNASGSLYCVNCPEGKHQNTSGHAGCARCPVGQFQTAGQGLCKSCAIGTYQSHAGQGSCIDCESGQFENRTGGVGCDQCGTCPTGSRTGCSGANAGFCAHCPPGKFANIASGALLVPQTSTRSQVDAKGCTLCQNGHYQNDQGKRFVILSRAVCRSKRVRLLQRRAAIRAKLLARRFAADGARKWR